MEFNLELQNEQKDLDAKINGKWFFFLILMRIAIFKHLNTLMVSMLSLNHEIFQMPKKDTRIWPAKLTVFLLFIFYEFLLLIRPFLSRIVNIIYDEVV